MGCLSLSAQPQTSAPEPATVQGTLHSIKMPYYNPDVPEGENRKLFLNSCTMCHSARYVLMQYHLPRTQWTAEVNKMHKAFGCPIDEASVEKLVDYLMTIRGAK